MQTPRNRKLLRGFERLEVRNLLAGELIAIELDVSQDGQSIVDEDRRFRVDVGDRFELEVRYDDLRFGPDKLGARAVFTDIITNLPDAFRPVVHEQQTVVFSEDLVNTDGGELVVGLENSDATVTIPFETLVAGISPAISDAAAELLGLSEDLFRVRQLVGSQFGFGFDFRDDSLAFEDIANLTFDASGLTGANVVVDRVEIPAFVDKDPARGINPQAAVTAFDARSSSLDDQELYGWFTSLRYNPMDSSVFKDVGGIDRVGIPLDRRFAAQGKTFTGNDIHAFSIRMEALEVESNIRFTAAPVDPSEDAFINLYPSVFELLSVDEILFDTDDDPNIAGDDRFALVIGDFGDASPPPYQNPVNRFDVNGDNEDGSDSSLAGLNDLNELTRELAERNVSDPVTGKLPDDPQSTVTTFFDVNGDGFVSQNDLDDLNAFLDGLSRFDFGDAPTSAQSGRASDYPTSLANNGARHVIGELRLGSVVDEELHASPNDDATGDDLHADDDEDGVLAITSVLTKTSSPQTASFEMTSSGAGVLDAWMDFNFDGDWNDEGERIFSGEVVSEGINLLSYSVPVSAGAGDTFARFRLTTDGIALPTGEAANGEVEDHLVTIEDASSNPRISIAAASESSLLRIADALVVQTNGSDIFRLPAGDAHQLSINGKAGDSILTLDFGGGAIVPPGGLLIDGGDGRNTLRVSGAQAILDFSSSGGDAATRFETLDLSDPGAATVTIDAAAVRALAPANAKLLVVGHEAGTTNNDNLVFTDESDWRMTDPSVRDGVFFQQATNLLSGERIEADVPSPWQNLIQASDVDNSGDVSARDAILIINELGRRSFSDPDTHQIIAPLEVASWPGNYYDQNGDGRISALDALRVINSLEVETVVAEGESSQIPLANIDGALTEWPTRNDDRTIDPPADADSSKLRADSRVEHTEFAELPIDSPVPPTTIAKDSVDSVLSSRLSLDWMHIEDWRAPQKLVHAI